MTLAVASVIEMWPPGLPPVLLKVGVKVPKMGGGAPGVGEGKSLTSQPSRSVSNVLWINAAGADAESNRIRARVPAEIPKP
jgi:hypothetical protein